MAGGEDTPQIGPRLRAARRAAGLTLDQLAARTELTKGFLSQLERDLTTPSVATLLRVCAVLEVPVGELFDAAQGPLVRAAQRAPIAFGGPGVEEFQLTPASERRMVVIASDLAPGGGSGEEAYRLAGEAEFVHVLDGRLDVEVAGTRHRLAAGDSLTFDAGAEHRWRNPSRVRRASVLWVVVPGFDSGEVRRA